MIKGLTTSQFQVQDYCDKTRPLTKGVSYYCGKLSHSLCSIFTVTFYYGLRYLLRNLISQLILSKINFSSLFYYYVHLAFIKF